MKNLKILAVRVMLLSGIALNSVFFSCQSESVELKQDAVSNKFTVKSNEPVTMTFSSAAKLISMNETLDCFTSEISIIVYMPGHGSSVWFTYISTGGPGCPDIISSPHSPGSPGTFPGGKPSISRYSYKGEWFEDSEVAGKASSLFDKYPAAYTSYVNARNKAIVKAGGIGY